jgi:hypothetical protein
MPGDAARGQVLYDALVDALPPPPPVKLAPELLVQALPEGALDFTHIAWSERIFRGGEVLEALIPNSDVPRFLDGEAARCEGDRFTKSGERKGKSCSFLCPCAGKPYESIYGPRNVLARGRALTASKKVGCEARFTVTYGVTPGVALVRYICYEHAEECRVQTPRRVSLTARLRIVAFLAHDPGLQPHTLVEKNVAAVAGAYAQRHGCSPAEAVKLFHAVRVRAARRGARIARSLAPRVSR